MRCEECLALAEEEFEGGLGEHDRAGVESHLAACAACAAEHRALVREQAVYSRFLLDVEPSPGLWENVRAGIERQRAEGASLVAGARAVGVASRFRLLFAGLFEAPGRAAVAACAVLLVVVLLAALVFVRRGGPGEVELAAGGDDRRAAAVAPPVVARPTAEPPRPSATTTTPAPDATQPRPRQQETFTNTAHGGERSAALATRVARARSEASRGAAEAESFRAWLDELRSAGASEGAGATSSGAAAGSPDFEAARHAERVEIALSSFLNSRAGGRGGVVDVSYERRQSQELLLQNVLLRREAQGAGDLPREALLKRIEPILLDIANLPAKTPADDVRQIKERMREREIVSALRLYSTQASGQAF